MRRTLLIAVILAAMLLSACATPATTPELAPTPTPVSYPTVVYEVRGSERPFDLKEYYEEWRRKHPTGSIFWSPPTPSEGEMWRGYASVSIINGTGGKEAYNGVPMLWRYTENSFSGEFLYVSARNLGDRGSITVSIYVNGELFKTSSSSGAYATATASGYR